MCGDVLLGAPAALQQHAAERLVGENASEVVHPAVAFGLADHGNDLVGGELTLADAGFEPRGVLHALQFDFGNLDGHSALSSLFCLPSGRARPRHHLTADHLLVAFATIDDRHGPCRARASFAAQRQGGRRPA